jgi:diguanylate cyclase (GGDEF)-like protein
VGIQQRYGHGFAVLVLDINGLKRVNDAFGHAAGDRMLMGVAAAVRATVRTIDTPVRMGGDEFCVLAPQQTASGAKILAYRVAAAVEQIETPDQSPIGVCNRSGGLPAARPGSRPPARARRRRHVPRQGRRRARGDGRRGCTRGRRPLRVQ